MWRKHSGRHRRAALGDVGFMVRYWCCKIHGNVGEQMSRTNEQLDFFRRLVVGSGTVEAKVRKLREYARASIPGVWHYPDDREPCPECGKLGLQIRHLPQAGIRGYLGPGPFSIVSD